MKYTTQEEINSFYHNTFNGKNIIKAFQHKTSNDKLFTFYLWYVYILIIRYIRIINTTILFVYSGDRTERSV